MRAEIRVLEEMIRRAENPELIERWRLDLAELQAAYIVRFPDDVYSRRVITDESPNQS